MRVKSAYVVGGFHGIRYDRTSVNRQVIGSSPIAGARSCALTCMNAWERGSGRVLAEPSDQDQHKQGQDQHKVGVLARTLWRMGMILRHNRHCTSAKVEAGCGEPGGQAAG